MSKQALEYGRMLLRLAEPPSPRPALATEAGAAMATPAAAAATPSTPTPAPAPRLEAWTPGTVPPTPSGAGAVTESGASAEAACSPVAGEMVVTPLPKGSDVKDNSSVVLQLSKTKMCAFYERGRCASATCSYAHAPSEIRSRPNLQKTKLCRAFLQGGCSAGENCGFAHGETDLRVTDGIYKTQLCNFHERGFCKKGERCNHAHGERELRPLSAVAARSTPLKTVISANAALAAASVQQQRHAARTLSVNDLIKEVDVSLWASALPASWVPPTPTRSVSELAAQMFSPMLPALPTSPMCWPVELPMWPPQTPLDPLDILLGRHGSPPCASALGRPMDAAAPLYLPSPVALLPPPPPRTPLAQRSRFGLASPLVPSAAYAESLASAALGAAAGWPPVLPESGGLAGELFADTPQSYRLGGGFAIDPRMLDPISIDLSNRLAQTLASLDSEVQEFSRDVAVKSGRPQHASPMRHRI